MNVSIAFATVGELKVRSRASTSGGSGLGMRASTGIVVVSWPEILAAPERHLPCLTGGRDRR